MYVVHTPVNKHTPTRTHTHTRTHARMHRHNSRTHRQNTRTHSRTHAHTHTRRRYRVLLTHLLSGMRLAVTAFTVVVALLSICTSGAPRRFYKPSKKLCYTKTPNKQVSNFLYAEWYYTINTTDMCMRYCNTFLTCPGIDYNAHINHCRIGIQNPGFNVLKDDTAWDHFVRHFCLEDDTVTNCDKDGFSEHTRRNGRGAVAQAETVNTVAKCTQACLVVKTFCHGFDFNNVHKTCHIHFNDNILIELYGHLNITHYKRNRCKTLGNCICIYIYILLYITILKYKYNYIYIWIRTWFSISRFPMCIFLYYCIYANTHLYLLFMYNIYIYIYIYIY